MKANWFGPVAAAIVELCLASPAQALTDPVGIWTMAAEGTSRQCRMQLRADPAAVGHAIAMPPGCHRALPVINDVRSWVLDDETRLSLVDETGQVVLVFDEQGDGSLRAAGPEGASYLLSPIGAPKTGILTAPASVTPTASARVQVPAEKPTLSVGAVAGHYAVMRGTRDTGCMVTLDEQTKGSPSNLKARLAPACRDQGIIIFDPVGWQLKAGHLILTARKGHTTDLDRDEAGVWTKNGGPLREPLGLKRL